MIFKDYYKILGLENSRVTVPEIKSAYREQAKIYHPDVNAQNSFSEERFKDINEAYRILSNSSSKRRYDRMWNNYAAKKAIKYEETKNTSGSMFGDFFNMFFGENTNNTIEEKNNKHKKNRVTPIKGENIETSIDISIEDAFYGAKKKISLRTVEGNMKNFEVKIPAGIRDNEKIRLIGQGKKGINGGSNGDLFIDINIKNDNRFKIKGYDLYTDLFLTPWEAALGTKANVVGIDDEASVLVPQGIQSGEVIKIPGKGYKDSRGGRGDLIANVKVMVPKKLTEEEKEIFSRLKEVSSFNPRNMY
jgi:curved DNA-binding protein